MDDLCPSCRFGYYWQDTTPGVCDGCGYELTIPEDGDVVIIAMTGQPDETEADVMWTLMPEAYDLDEDW